MNSKRQQKVFIVNEVETDIPQAEKEVLIHHSDASIDTYTDYKKLLYKLHKSFKFQYAIGIIHENGSKAKPSVISSFVRQLSPEIRIIIYNSIDGLKQQLQEIKI